MPLAHPQRNGDAKRCRHLVTFALNARLDAFAFAGIVRDLEGWVGARVDVAVRNRLKPEVRAEALRDEIRAF
jgi:predicted nucleotidyltransferase